MRLGAGQGTLHARPPLTIFTRQRKNGRADLFDLLLSKQSMQESARLQYTFKLHKLKQRQSLQSL